MRSRFLPRRGETVIGGEVARLAGGKGANQAMAAAALGAAVSLVACVGHDSDGDWLREQLVKGGVDVRGLSRSPRPTGTAFITVDDEGENQIVVAPGANADLTVDDVELAAFDAVLVQCEVNPAVNEAVARRARSLILNAAPAGRVEGAVLERSAVVIVNEAEAQALDLDALEHCVVTEGARGAVHLRHGRAVARVAAPVVDVVDTVGAGDVFCAAYAVAFLRGAEAESALRYAVTAGSLATRAPGAQGSLPTDEEVVRWLRRG